MSENHKPANRLLAALPAKEYQHLLTKLEEVSLPFTETIYAPDEIIRYVYFPNSGIISLLAAVGERSQLEVGIVGNEGMVGLPVFLGVKMSNNHALVQGAGAAMRIKYGGLSDRMQQRRRAAPHSATLHALDDDSNFTICSLQSFSPD